MIIRGVFCPLFNFALCWKFNIITHTRQTHVVICVMDILVVNEALSKNRHWKGRKWLVKHKIYINNNNKTYSYKAGLISPPRLQEHTKLVLWNQF